ncbi:uncharacterized protein K452DRAFT_81269 [Aplosporella prunicola CBS 121167]|uniref:Uncharacterized protein n=1 Tax=Aplosporella prunicola CBS 121167 TaxID=1176127 RepID=A0A6A6B9H4_9PEZI|nr:uncharacterized protein K452DRAFT_81269 [Aplosporella prunicola CBS 121167]KAF2139131.1 hypothetical protein K452DRAFT_81269 [Aplosporella prunicola CBS 121167]
MQSRTMLYRARYATLYHAIPCITPNNPSLTSGIQPSSPPPPPPPPPRLRSVKNKKQKTLKKSRDVVNGCGSKTTT